MLYNIYSNLRIFHLEGCRIVIVVVVVIVVAVAVAVVVALMLLLFVKIMIFKVIVQSQCYFLLVSFSFGFRNRIDKLGGESFQIVGFFSNCHNTNANNATENEAFIFDKTAEFIYGRNYDRNNAWNTMFPSKWIDFNLNYTFDYISFNICDERDLLKILMDIHLDKKYFINNNSQHPPSFNKHIISNWQQQTKILFIASYLPTSMTKILTEVTLTSQIPVAMLNETKSESIYHHDTHLRFKPSIFEFATKSYDLLVNTLQSRSVIILLFVEPTQTIDETISILLAAGLEHNHICYTFINVSSRSVDVYFKIVHYLLRDNPNQVIALFGNEFQQIRFLDIAMYSRLDNRTWLVHHVMNLNLPYAKILPNTTIYSLWSLDMWLCSHINVGRRLFTTANHSKVSYRNLEAICEYETVFDILVMAVKLLDAKTNPAGYNIFRNEFLNLFYPKLYLYKFLTVNHKIIAKPWSKNNIQKLWQNCTVFTCPPGWEKHYGRLLKNHTVWPNSVGWTCKQCERNFTKSYFGDGPCTRCSDLQMSNLNGTTCYDPFVNRSIRVQMTSVKLLIALSAIIFLVNAFLLCLFFKYRDTPAVKAADIKFITLQIITSSLITVVLPLLTIGEPSYINCVCKPIAISILFTLSFSIFLIKSLTMVRAFSSDVVLTRKEIVYTSMAQWFIIGVLLLIGQSMIIITLMTTPVKVNEVLHHNILKRDNYCNTGSHMQLQIAYFIILLVFSSAQAFRARRLPIMFNESMPIVYSSFVLVILFSVTFPIFHFQENPLDKHMTLWGSLSVANALLIVIMYSRRVYIIIFKSRMNTKAFLQRKILQNIRQSVK